MPVRSLNASVLKGPDAHAVDEAVRRWAERLAAGRPEVVRTGYFGSCARGDRGVGSDLDLLIVVERSDRPFARRAADWDATDLPVPADVLVYTVEEWKQISSGGRFGRMLGREVKWIYGR